MLRPFVLRSVCFTKGRWAEKARAVYATLEIVLRTTVHTKQSGKQRVNCVALARLTKARLSIKAARTPNVFTLQHYTNVLPNILSSILCLLVFGSFHGDGWRIKYKVVHLLCGAVSDGMRGPPPPWLFFSACNIGNDTGRTNSSQSDIATAREVRPKQCVSREFL